MTNEIKQKNNIKLYPLYKMFSWDLLFYYSIIFLFLTLEKGFSAANILFADAFYPLFKIIFQIPCTTLIDWAGKKNSIVIANIFISTAILFLIFGDTLNFLIISNMFMAFGFNVKEMSESTLLYDSIKDNSYRSSIFSKIDGKATSYYYYLDAFCSILTGFLFVFNGYAPMVCCFIFSCIATYISLKFKDCRNPIKPKELWNEQTNSIKEYLKELINIFKFIFKSGRLKGLLIYSSIFASLLGIMNTLRSSLLYDIQLPEIYFGLVVAGLQFISAFASKKQNLIHQKFRNKTLTFFALSNTISLIFVGIIIFTVPITFIKYLSVFIWLFINAFTKGPYHIMIRRYLHSFTTQNVNTKIYSAQIIFNSIIRIPITLFASFIFSVTLIPISFIFLGIILTLLFVIVLSYMKPRVGLQPEDYKKSDIDYNDFINI